MQIVRAAKRHFSDFGWLKTYWLFSFSDYYDPRNLQFGTLRVFNDDVVQPGEGFPTHPHREMEIVTVVLDGVMTHKDSMGNTAVISAGDVQRMSAGTGLTHSEYNFAKKPVHFYQIWIVPDHPGLSPTYDQRTYEASAWKNRLLPVASGRGLPGTVTFHTDATIYRAAFDAGRGAEFAASPGRGLFLYVTRGAINVDADALDEHDQLRAPREKPLALKARTACELIAIDVALR